MNTEIITSIIAAVAAVLAAAATAYSGVSLKKNQAAERKRAEEARLQLAMISANSKLTVGVAMALKNGQCNGEVEAGLLAVEQANRQYQDFLLGVAMDSLTGTSETM